jgi:hypothetical protein
LVSQTSSVSTSTWNQTWVWQFFILPSKDIIKNNCYLLSPSFHIRKDILVARTKFENKGQFFLRKCSWQLYVDVAKKKDVLKPF